jgi:hypothetical protein
MCCSSTAVTKWSTFAFVMVAAADPKHSVHFGFPASPLWKMSTLTARWLPSGCGMPVTPTNEPRLLP